MFDTLPDSAAGSPAAVAAEAETVPLERLEAQICELAGHLTAATCRFPGCESRRVDLHHIQYWSHGGRTSLDNLISLCPFHHKLVHDRGYLIARRHDADITADTIIPPWFGERLDLDYAIYTCFANAANAASRRDASQPDQVAQPDRQDEAVPSRDWDGECECHKNWGRPIDLFESIEALRRA
jgi:hypothetical protein